MGRYEDRISAVGRTRRERNLTHTKKYLSRHLKESIAYKDVKINGVDSHLVIDYGNQTYWKRFRTLINGIDEDFTEVLVGDYIDFAGFKWIVHDADSEMEMFIDGIMYQCNYLLKWQDEAGAIIERWTHISNASSYNTGKDYSYPTTIGTNQLMVYLPIDEDTVKLERDKRVFCDFTNKGVRYKFARVDSVSESYGKGGLLYIIMTEDLEHHDSDNEELQICDYFEPTTTELVENTIVSSIDYVTDTIILNGSKRDFTAVFLDANGKAVDGYTAEWELTADFDFDYTIDGNTVSVGCSDKDALGSELKINITNRGMESELSVLVVK